MRPLFCPRCRLRIRVGFRHCMQCNYRIPTRILRDRADGISEDRAIVYRDKLSLL